MGNKILLKQPKKKVFDTKISWQVDVIHQKLNFWKIVNILLNLKSL